MTSIIYCGQQMTNFCNLIDYVYDMSRDILHESAGILWSNLAMVPGLWKNIGEENY